MMPFKQLHLDESVFGPNVNTLDSERFVPDPKLRRHASLGFGGGATQCPGRFLAMQATLVLVEMMVHRFDVSIDPPGQPFPEMEEANPVLRIIDVKRSHDLTLKLTR